MLKKRIVSMLMSVLMLFGLVFGVSTPIISDAGADDIVTFYFRENNFSKELFPDGYYAYLTNDDESVKNTDWPGEELDYAGVDTEGYSIYSIDVDVSVYSYICVTDGGIANNSTYKINIHNGYFYLGYPNNAIQLTQMLSDTNDKGGAYLKYEACFIEFPATTTVYAEDTYDWGHLYVWLSDSSDSGNLNNGSFPGQPMTYAGKDKTTGKDIYSVTFNTEDYDQIKFGNGRQNVGSTNLDTNEQYVRTNGNTALSVLTDGNNAFRITGDNKVPTTFKVNPDDLDASDVITVYFRNDLGWSKVYAWVTKSGTSKVASNGRMPGWEMTYEGKVTNEEGNKVKVYSFTFASGTFDQIKFSYGYTRNSNGKATGADYERTAALNYATLLTGDNNCFYVKGGDKTNYQYNAYTTTIDPDNYDDSDSIKIYYRDDICWGDPYLFAYNDSTGEKNKSWPGEQMEFEGMDGTTRVYSATIDSDLYSSIEFNDGSYGYIYPWGRSNTKRVPDRKTVPIDYRSDIAAGNNCFTVLGDADNASGSTRLDYDAISLDPDTLNEYEGFNNVTTKAKNVIYMIGDGNGIAQIQATEYYLRDYTGEQYVTYHDPDNEGWYSSWQTTHSADYPDFTDSAAAATALATGVKASDQAVGMNPDEDWVENLIEFSEARGLNTGLVATQTIIHATPAGFAAHTRSRKNNSIILNQTLRQDIEVLFGGGKQYLDKTNGNYVANSDLWVTENDYSYITDFTELDSIDEDQKVLGLWSSDKYNNDDAESSSKIPTLAEATQAALDRLDGSSDDENFFIMVEGSNIDSYAHSNNLTMMLKEGYSFNEAVKVAQNYVDEHPDTLLIVTADHETGGLDLNNVSNYAELVAKNNALSSSLWKAMINSGDCTHTGIAVPVYAYGAGAEELTQYNAIDNTEIYDFVVDVLNNEYGEADSNILDQDRIVYFQKPDDWEDIYVYSDSISEMSSGSGAAMVLIDPENNVYAYAISSRDSGITISFNDGSNNTTSTTTAKYNDYYYYIDSSGVLKYSEYNAPDGIIYFKNTLGWKNVGLYAWDSVNGGIVRSQSWPGSAMKHIGDNIWMYALQDSIAWSGNLKLIFNNYTTSETSLVQTVNLNYVGFNVMYTPTDITGSKYNATWQKYPVDANSNDIAGTIYFELPTSWTSPSIYLSSGAYAGTEPGVAATAAMTKVDGTDNIYSVDLANGNLLNQQNFQVRFMNDSSAGECTLDIRFEGFNKVYTITSNENTQSAAGSWSRYISDDEPEPPVIMNTITAIADGNGTVSINESEPADTYTNNYQVGETVTIEAQGDLFRYWTNSNNKVVSTEASFTITAATDEEYTAMFAKSHTVSFMSNGQLIKTIIVAEDATEIDSPDSPFSYGHTFIRWDMEEEDILNALKTGDVIVNAVYEKILNNHYIDITSGKTTGWYETLTLVSVTADEPEEGKQFSHWVDGDGNIMNYKSTYNFYVTKAVDLEAVYVEKETEVEKPVLMQITNVVNNLGANKISFTAERSLSEGVTLVQHGIILTNDSTLDENTFCIGANGVLKGTAVTTGMNGTYVLNKGNVQEGDTWHARGYVIYKDAAGTIKTVYSKIATQTLE